MSDNCFSRAQKADAFMSVEGCTDKGGDSLLTASETLRS